MCNEGYVAALTKRCKAKRLNAAHSKRTSLCPTTKPRIKEHYRIQPHQKGTHTCWLVCTSVAASMSANCTNALTRLGLLRFTLHVTNASPFKLRK